jgi:hypothetical protein
MVGSWGLVVVALSEALAAEDAASAVPVRVRTSEPVPALLGAEAELVRCSDGARIAVHAGEPLADLQPGAYRCGARVVLVRTDDSAAAQALSVVGLPILVMEKGDQEQAAAYAAAGFNEFSLPVYAWRQADGWPWPWVTHGAYWGGLSGICWRITTDGKPHAYAPALRAYAASDGSALRIVDAPPSRELQAVRLGDLVAAKGATAVLVRDLGEPGVLDPADEVVTACVVDGQPALVRVARLGDLVGEQPIDCYTRDRPRGADRNRPPPDPDNPLHKLSFKRQMVALGGMFALCALLMFRARRLLRKQRERGMPIIPRAKD